MSYHSAKCISSEDLSKIELLMQEVILSADLKRLQCVYFRGKYHYTLQHISILTQLSEGHIQRIWTQYFKHGMDALLTKPRGGRRSSLLTEAEEIELLSKHIQSGSKGQIVEIDALHHSLCERVGKPVALSTAYRLAHRHGWRKIAPRPFHVKRNSTQAEYFKIFSENGGGR